MRGASRPRRALVAPDSFKGTLPARRVAEALAAGLEPQGWEVDRCPLADGGEGTVEALISSWGGRTLAAEAHDPLGRPLEARFGLAGERGVAVVEVAAASGLVLLSEDERDPERASTRGTGELIVAASRRAGRVLVGAGGSATNDGGRGAIEAIREAGGIGSTQLVCLCDAVTPWERASAVFAPQKGAGPDQVARLERRLERLAGELPRDPRGIPLTGAAGGLAGGLWAALGAELAHGAPYVCDQVGLDSRVRQADVVITGEGRLDETTLEGKVLAEVATRARGAGVEVHAVVGEDAAGPGIHRRLGLAAVREASTPQEIASAAADTRFLARRPRNFRE